eukprot:4348105-Amphidinium_carterae.1
MEELQSQRANVTMEVMYKRNAFGAVRQERLFHGGHVLAELVPFGRRDGQMGLLSGAREDAANVHRVGLGVQCQQGRICGLVEGHCTSCVEEHPLFSHRVPSTCPGKFAPHVS